MNSNEAGPYSQGGYLFQKFVRGPDSGQPLSGSFMDYTMPRADDVPFFAFSPHNVPSTANPLGVKGAGEAGAVGGTGRRTKPVQEMLTAR